MLINASTDIAWDKTQERIRQRIQKGETREQGGMTDNRRKQRKKRKEGEKTETMEELNISTV